MENTVDLETALCEVRKAYRLLWLFQRRVFDICETIRDNFGVKFYCVGYHFDRPASSSPFKKWSWDMLPMSNISFLFLRHKGENPHNDGANYPMPDDYLLSIHVMPDSALIDFRLEGEPDPMQFPAANTSESKLGLYLYYNDAKRMDENRQPSRTNWYERIWSPLRQIRHAHSIDHPLKGIRTYGSVLSLSRLDSAEAIRKHVKEFRDAVKVNLNVEL